MSSNITFVNFINLQFINCDQKMYKLSKKLEKYKSIHSIKIHYLYLFQ